MKPTRRVVHPLSSADIQRRTPGLPLDEAQFESAVSHRPWHASFAVPPRRPGLEGAHAGLLPAHHAHVSLEGPQIAARKRPHISLSLEGPQPPLRAALAHQYSLEGGSVHKLLRAQRLSPALVHLEGGRALIHRKRKRK